MAGASGNVQPLVMNVNGMGELCSNRWSSTKTSPPVWSTLVPSHHTRAGEEGRERFQGHLAEHDDSGQFWGFLEWQKDEKKQKQIKKHAPCEWGVAWLSPPRDRNPLEWGVAWWSLPPTRTMGSYQTAPMFTTSLLVYPFEVVRQQISPEPIHSNVWG